ncbi:hypothetical protein [Arenibacter certesii]|uniref:Uncharacterized protein n=1 Tax=Arenibacter certesii TaxID=228955 RepID=A0A918IRS2_9FLAO|nr:hypothetical protein [Arenibacter certesii]GGW27446.1 hypothetical protein GCM10007383_11040 [Arenibacter certesii]
MAKAFRIWFAKDQAIVVWDSIDQKATFKTDPAVDTFCQQALLGISLIHNNKVKGVLVLANENSSKSPKFYGKLFGYG